ncbi:MAG: GvpL/GvpF family gas vesicle protein, partial [Vulcanimicrobiaceae bacterium]
PYVVRVAERAERGARAALTNEAGPVGEHARALFGACEELAVSVRRIATAERGTLWSAAFLLERERAVSLAERTEASAERGSALGVSAYLEPPHAPFSFA